VVLYVHSCVLSARENLFVRNSNMRSMVELEACGGVGGVNRHRSVLNEPHCIGKQWALRGLLHWGQWDQNVTY
jgi:hypothetical protein